MAALVSRIAPREYKKIIERRHLGVKVNPEEASDVRSLKEEALHRALEAIDSTNLELLAKIDDRVSWVVLVSPSDYSSNPAELVAKLVEYGMRVRVSFQGGRSKIIRSSDHLTALKRGRGDDIVSIRAGNVWMRARGRRQIGWHAAVRIHLYDWDPDSNTYRARDAGSLPPMIDKPDAREEGIIIGLSTPSTRLDKVPFPIDVVYTWVDGNDPEWNERRRIRSAQLGYQLPRVANSAARYKNRDELRYSLRSLYYFSPWVRKIYLVTDDQVPDWYEPGCEMIEIISHRELFPDERSLPTFNSHAIESVLHRIPGLSEHFLYMNDDVFFSSVIHAEAFFEVNGIARTFLSRAMIPFCRKSLSDVASEWGAMNANELLYQDARVMMPYKTRHTPIPLRRSLLAELEARFPKRFERLRQSPFRTRDDLAPTSSLHAYFGLQKGLVVRSHIAYRYVNLARPNLREALQSIAFSQDALVYCLNDTEVDDKRFNWQRQEAVVRKFLDMMYPYSAPWEKGWRNVSVDDGCEGFDSTFPVANVAPAAQRELSAKRQ